MTNMVNDILQCNDAEIRVAQGVVLERTEEYTVAVLLPSCHSVMRRDFVSVALPVGHSVKKPAAGTSHVQQFSRLGKPLADDRSEFVVIVVKTFDVGIAIGVIHEAGVVRNQVFCRDLVLNKNKRA